MVICSYIRPDVSTLGLFYTQIKLNTMPFVLMILFLIALVSIVAKAISGPDTGYTNDNFID